MFNWIRTKALVGFKFQVAQNRSENQLNVSDEKKNEQREKCTKFLWIDFDIFPTTPEFLLKLFRFVVDVIAKLTNCMLWRKSELSNRIKVKLNRSSGTILPAYWRMWPKCTIQFSCTNASDSRSGKLICRSVAQVFPFSYHLLLPRISFVSGHWIFSRHFRHAFQLSNIIYSGVLGISSSWRTKRIENWNMSTFSSFTPSPCIECIHSLSHLDTKVLIFFVRSFFTLVSVVNLHSAVPLTMSRIFKKRPP